MKIRFIDLGDVSFILRDLDVLQKDGFRISRTSHSTVKANVPAMLLLQFVLEPFALLRSDRLIVHFGGWHALIPLFWARVLRRPSILFLHGTDCASIPEINYGNHRKQPLAWITSMCYRFAGKLAPVHESLVKRTDRYTFSDTLFNATESQPSEQGVLHFVPDLRTPIDVVHHGFNPERWPMSGENDPNVLITVGFDLHTARIRKLKGIDVILAVAERFPDRRFVLVGFDQEPSDSLPLNVEVHGRVGREELIRHYQKAGYYLQLSLSEGFGCALAEAMLCGCIPVVSRAGAPPFIVGDHGAIVESRTIDEVENTLLRLFASYDATAHQSAREHVASKFALDRRAAGLLRLLDG